MMGEYELRLKQLGQERESLQMELARICAVLKTGALRSGDAAVDDPIANIQYRPVADRTGDWCCRVALSELHQSDAAKVVKLTLETHEIASKMSATIRKRDRERERVLMLKKKMAAIQATHQNIERLESELQTGELHGLCEIFSAILLASAEEDVKEGWTVYYGDKEIGLADKVSTIRAALLRRLLAEVGAAEAEMVLQPSETIDEKMGRVFNLILLFRSIECTDDGLKAVAGVMQKYAAYSLKTIAEAPSSLDFRFAVKAGKVSEFVRGLLRWCEQRLAAIACVEGVGMVAARVFGEAEASLIHIMRAFTAERKLVESMRSRDDLKSPMTGELNIKDMDLLAAEMAMIIQNSCLVAREREREREFLAMKNPKYLADLQLLYGSMSDLLSSYSLVEILYLNSGAKLAVAMSEIGPQLSTSTEDVFFLIKKSALRAAAVAEYTVVLDVLGAACALIRDHFVPFLQKRSRQLFPDVKTGDSVLIAANDARSGRQFLTGILDELQPLLDGDDSALFSLDNIRHSEGRFTSGIPNLSRSKITSALNDLEIQGDHLEALAKSCLESIYATQIKTKLGVLLAQVCKDLLSPDMVADSPLRRLIAFIEKTVQPIIAVLIEENRVSIGLMVSAEIAGSLEKTILASPWSEPLVESLAPGLRSLVSYLADQTDLEAKNLLQRTLQMVSILDNPTLQEAQAMLNDDFITGSPTWRITKGEASILLRSRTDW